MYSSSRRSWQKPAQHGVPGFSGGYAEVILDEPILIQQTIYHGNQGAATFDSVWNSKDSVWRHPKPAKPSWKERGWWRMNPRFMFEEDIYRSSTIRKGTGAIQFRGEFYRIPERPFHADPGWTVQRLEKRIVDLPIVFSNETGLGGSAQYQIDSTRLTFDLSYTGLQVGKKYLVSFDMNWDSPYAKWDLPKPKVESEKALREAQYKLRMDPRLVIEVFDAILLDQKTGKAKRVTQPTGWVMGTGRYFGY